MKRLLLSMMILGTALALTAQTEGEKEEPVFQPPETHSTTDIYLSATNVANGTAVVDAVISETGKLQTIEVRRDMPALTELLVSAVKEWEFSPATFAGKAITSRVPVALTARPPASVVSPVPLPALKPQTDAAIQAEYQAAEVIHAAFPRATGFTTINSLTVVLEVSLSADGKPEEVKVLGDVPGLTAEAKGALDDWRFMAATLNGRPVASKMVLVFAFRPVAPN